MREIKCFNCGAMFSPDEAKCPFCGHINPSGAETKFMHRLGKTRNSLNSISDDIKATHAKEKSKGIRFIAKIVIPIVVILLLLFGAVNLIEHISSSSYDKVNYTEELVWQHKRFEEYNRMFENKEYETLLEAIANDGEKHEVFNWEHYDEFSKIADELWGDK